MSQGTDVAVRSPLSAEIAEQVIVGGDLSKMSPGQRVEHYLAVCSGLGLDWRTRPFDYLKDKNGRLVMYARKDCTEQLRKRDNISLTIVDRKAVAGLFLVTARADAKDGRHDEDLGAVACHGLEGEAFANAMMRAVTKAKRRVTLSICGLGIPDESEIESIEGAVRVEAELPEGARPGVGYEARDVIDQPAKPPAEPPAVDPSLLPPKWTQPDYVLRLRDGTSRVMHSGSEYLDEWRVGLEHMGQQRDAIRKVREMNRSALAAIADFDPQAAAEVEQMLDAALKEPEA